MMSWVTLIARGTSALLRQCDGPKRYIHIRSPTEPWRNRRSGWKGRWSPIHKREASSGHRSEALQTGVPGLPCFKVSYQQFPLTPRGPYKAFYIEMYLFANSCSDDHSRDARCRIDSCTELFLSKHINSTAHDAFTRVSLPFISLARITTSDTTSRISNPLMITFCVIISTCKRSGFSWRRSFPQAA